MIKPQARCVSLPQFSISKSKTANMSLILSLMNIIKLYQLGFLLRFCHLNGSCKNNNWIALGTTTDTHLFALLEKERTNRLVVDSFFTDDMGVGWTRPMTFCYWLNAILIDR